MDQWFDLKDSLSLTRLITDITGLDVNKKGTSNFLESCPFCGSGTGKNGTSAFSIKKDISFKCFACDKKGDAVSFVSEFKNITSGQAIKLLIDQYGGGLKNNKERVFTTWEKRLYAIKNNPKHSAINYLANERMIDVNKLPETAYYYDVHKNAIVFPSHTRKLLNYRFLPPNDVNEGRCRNYAYEENILCKSLYLEVYKPKCETVFLTEGVINAYSLMPRSVISIFSSGNCVGIDILGKYIENKKVVLAFDNDEPGEKAFRYYKSLIENSGLALEIRKLNLPIPIKCKDSGKLIFKDVNDLLKENTLIEWLKKKSNYELLYENRLLQPILLTSHNIEESYSNQGFYHKDGVYYGRDQKGKERKISNFLMDILYHFSDDTKNSFRYIKLQKNEEGTLNVDYMLFDSESLSSIQKFKSALYSLGEYIFSGSTKDLDMIKEELGRNIEKAVRMGALGWSEEFEVYVFANCIIDGAKVVATNRFGIVSAKGSSLFIPALSEIYKNDIGFSFERRFKYKQSSITVNKFYDLIRRTFRVNGIIGLLFTMSSIFSDIIAKELNFFPLLFLYGTAGAGKSKFTNFYLGFFGEPQTAISLSGFSTGKAMMRKLSQFSNALVYLNEYKTEIAGKVDDMIVNIYDRVGYDRAQPTGDNRTTQTKVSSGVIIDGNFLPVKHPRTYSRLIQLDFLDNDFTHEQKKAFNELQKYLKDYTFSSLLFEVLQLRKKVSNNFREEYYQTDTEIRQKYADCRFDDRIISNYSVLLTILRLTEKELKIPCTYLDSLNNIMDVAKAQQAVLAQTNELEQFFEAIETNVDSAALSENIKYDQECVYFNLSAVYRIYQDDMRKISGLAIDQSSLRKLLLKHPFYIKEKPIKIVNRTKRVMVFKRDIFKNI